MKTDQAKKLMNTEDGKKLKLQRETLRELERTEPRPGDEPRWTTCTAHPPQHR